MSDDYPGSTRLNRDSSGPIVNDEVAEVVRQDFLLTSTKQLRPNSLIMQTSSSIRIGKNLNRRKWLPMPIRSPRTVLDTSVQYGASQDPSISNPSLSSLYSTNNLSTTPDFNQYVRSPNGFDAPGSPPLPISDNSTTQTVPPSFTVSPSPSSSDLNRTGVVSEEENIQKIWDVVLQTVEDNYLTGATIDAISSQNMKFILAKVVEHKLLKNLNGLRYLETARKIFWLALKLKDCGFILALLRLQSVRTPNMVNAAYDLAMRCQDLDLVEYLVTESIVDLGDYDPFAGFIIQDHFSDVNVVEDTFDPWYRWHLARQKGEFYVSSLEFASMQQNAALVQLLLHNKADPRTRPSNRSSLEVSYASYPINPLYYAISGRVPLSEKFYNSPFSPIGFGISRTIHSGISKTIIQILIAAGADVDSHSGCHNRYQRESEDQFQGIPVGPEFTPIYKAACRGEAEIVELLLKNGAQVKKGSRGELALLGLLLHSDDTDKSNSSQIAKMLIDSGIDVNLTKSISEWEENTCDLASYEVNAIDLAHQFVQPEIIRLLNDSGAVSGERTLDYAFRRKDSNLIRTLLRSLVTSGNLLSNIDKALTQKMPDIATHILSTFRAKHGPDFGLNSLRGPRHIKELMECIQKAIRLEYYDVTHQLISIAETLPSMPGTSSHFHATCMAAENDWDILASQLFKIARYRKSIWEMHHKDWEEIDFYYSCSPVYPWDWHSRTIRLLLDAHLYPLSSEIITIAIMVSAQDGDEELVKRLLDLASEDPLIDVPATNEQIKRFMQKHNDSGHEYSRDSVCTVWPSLSGVISAGHLNIAYILLEHGFTVDDKAFDIVIQKGDYSALDRFLCAYNGCRREIYVDNDSIRILCAEEGKLLFDSKLISTHNGIFINPLPIAKWVISNSSLNLLTKLLEEFSGHNLASSDFLLNTAVEFHRHGMLKEALRYFNKRGKTSEEGFGQEALLRAFEDADMESMYLLLAFRVSPSTTGLPHLDGLVSSVLSRAIEEHSPARQEILSLILTSSYYDTGDIVQEKNGMHNTALLAAVVADNLDSVRLLIEFEYSVNEVPTRKTLRTPLQAACSSSSHVMIELLVASGADINAPAFELRGGTALQFAVIRGDYEIVNYLLDSGADLKAPGAKVGGRTAVEAAAEHGRVRILELLLSHGQTFDGESGERQYKRACKLAEKNGHETAKWILERFWIEIGVKLLQPANNNGTGSDEN
jgi:ankyrin repeat protein